MIDTVIKMGKPIDALFLDIQGDTPLRQVIFHPRSFRVDPLQ
jgi:hypothetical protein